MRIYEARINYNIINLGAVEAIDIPQKVVGYLKHAEEQNPAVENFWVVALDRKNKPIAYSTVTTGIATASLVHPREVFRYAIMQGACSIIVAHNHPSGDPIPSGADIQVTRQLKEASRAIQIDLLDHVILGDKDSDPNRKGYYSFSEAGML